MFSLDDPHYYSYGYTVSSDGQRFTARANGDVDCDGSPPLRRINELE